jgi:hypothetical protein
VFIWMTSSHLVLGFPTGLYYEISHWSFNAKWLIKTLQSELFKN